MQELLVCEVLEFEISLLPFGNVLSAVMLLNYPGFSNVFRGNRKGKFI